MHITQLARRKRLVLAHHAPACLKSQHVHIPSEAASMYLSRWFLEQAIELVVPHQPEPPHDSEASIGR